MSKAWFITGASSGIGLGLARFAAHLIPGCRRFSPR
jgi:NAD(P)-dependent dehydrogenase (short-subunit alcohol dehydrogenase family)